MGFLRTTVTIRDEIIERTGRNVSRGSVYAGLERLEEKGLLISSLSDPTPERGGRAKRYYKISASGEVALHVSRRGIEKMTEGLQWAGKITLALP
jgi:PadR family transcriptional regulator, regulatory protein PadR